MSGRQGHDNKGTNPSEYQEIRKVDEKIYLEYYVVWKRIEIRCRSTSHREDSVSKSGLRDKEKEAKELIGGVLGEGSATGGRRGPHRPPIDSVAPARCAINQPGLTQDALCT